MQKEFALPTNLYLHYGQAVSFIHKMTRAKGELFPNTTADQIYKLQKPSTRNIYASLIAQLQSKDTNKTLANWARDFPNLPDTEQLINGYSKIRRIAVNETWRETQYTEPISHLLGYQDNRMRYSARNAIQRNRR